MVYSDELFSLVLMLLFVKYLECNESKKALRIVIIHFVVCEFSLVATSLLGLSEKVTILLFILKKK